MIVVKEIEIKIETEQEKKLIYRYEECGSKYLEKVLAEKCRE